MSGHYPMPNIPGLRQLMGSSADGGARSRRALFADVQPDRWILVTTLILLCFGLVMVSSASITIADRELGQPFHFLYRQLAYVGMGIGLGALVLRIPIAFWERHGMALILISVALLVLVLVPVVGRSVNGSTRWLALGPFNLQVSELAKLFTIIYLAGYLVRRSDEVRTAISGFLRPMILLSIMVLLLLMEPDFGAAAVMLATALAMMWLGGVRWWQFALLMATIAGALMLLAVSSPYRLERLTTFLNPWADPYNSGFQLTQALIAFGRGEWFGVGLGGSVQKLFYLPEAHTDFLFAVLAEELGLVGAASVVLLFSVLVGRALIIGRRAERAGRAFAAYLAYGLGLWIGLQAFINIGVNMGILPTKGLTLPLMSYGGSSVLANCLAVALLLRVALENEAGEAPAATSGPRVGRGSTRAKRGARGGAA
ncbi:MAG: putative lipid II flippase FtsW [Gammaproteobacteria bacterium]